MTKEQSNQIDELRSQGKGYKSIAAAVGISVDKVRYYCKKNGMAGVGKTALVADGLTCPLCGTAISQPDGRGRKKKFCSEHCRSLWWGRHPNALKSHEDSFYEYTCQCCGKQFKTRGNKHRKYCSRECFIKMRFWT